MKPFAVLFDFGETLMHIVDYDTLLGNKYLFENVNNPKGVRFKDYIEYRNYLSGIIEEKRNLSNLEHSWRSFNNIVNAKFDLASPADINLELEYWKLINKHELAPDIVFVLDYLKDGDIPMGVISNSMFSGNILKYEFSIHGIDHYFQFILSSADLGIRKPEKEIFNTASSRLGITNNEILFIGDAIKADYEGSRSAGMIPLLYRGLNRYEIGNGHNTIDDWRELPEIYSEFGLI
jgi:putative hydrolase of the HAD superfamily